MSIHAYVLHQFSKGETNPIGGKIPEKMALQMFKIHDGNVFHVPMSYICYVFAKLCGVCVAFYVLQLHKNESCNLLNNQKIKKELYFITYARF